MALHHRYRHHIPTLGSTLMEMMFGVVVLAMASSIALMVYVLSLKGYRTEAGQNQATGSAQTAAEFLRRDIRASNAVIASFGPHVASESVLILSAPSYDSSGVISGSFDQICYRVISGNKLARSVTKAGGSLRTNETDRPLVRGISAIHFTYRVHDFFRGNGTTTAYTLSSGWTSNPTCRVNGILVTEDITYNSGNRTAYFNSPPANNAVIEFTYPISPASSGALSAVSEVAFTITSASDSSLIGTKQISGNARLRNKFQ